MASHRARIFHACARNRIIHLHNRTVHTDSKNLQMSNDLLAARLLSELFCYTVLYTMQTFHSCTSRPDVCQCLAVLTPMYIMPKNRTSTSVALVLCESKLLSVVRSSRQSGVRSGIMPGQPAHLVQELNVCTYWPAILLTALVHPRHLLSHSLPLPTTGIEIHPCNT